MVTMVSQLASVMGASVPHGRGNCTRGGPEAVLSRAGRGRFVPVWRGSVNATRGVYGWTKVRAVFMLTGSFYPGRRIHGQPDIHQDFL